MVRLSDAAKDHLHFAALIREAVRRCLAATRRRFETTGQSATLADSGAHGHDGLTAASATPAARACDEALVKRRAKAGLATVLVAITVALLTLAGAGATLLVTGIVPLPGLEGRIAEAIQHRLGPGWRVDTAAAELGRIDGRSQLRVRQVVFRHSSGASIRAPEAVLGYVPLSLLWGEIRLVSVDLRGVNVRLGVSADGALIVNADAAPVEAQPLSTLPDAAQWNAFTGIMGAVATLAQGDGLLGALETAGMNGARLYLIDPEGRQKAGFEDVEIRLTRVGERTTRLTMKGRTGQRWKELAIDLSTDAGGTQRAEIDIIRFEPAEVVALAFGAGGIAIDELPLKGKATLLQTPEGRKSLTAVIDVQPGTVRFPDGAMPAMAVEAARFEIASQDDLAVLQLTSGELRVGKTHLKGRGTLREENGAWRLMLDGAGLLAGVDHDPAVVVDRVTANLLLDPRSGEARIDAVSVRGPAIAADVTGYIQKTGSSPTQRITVRAVESNVRQALALWPRFTSPELHTTLSRQFVAGRVARLDVDLDLSAEDHAAMLAGAGIPDKALSVVIDASQVRFQPAPGLPPLIDATIAGSATGRTVQLTIPKASADLGEGRSLALSEGSFAVPAIWTPRPLARVAFRSSGSVEALAALANFPALRELSPGRLEPGAVRGASDLRTVVTLPLADDLKPDEIVIQSSGTLTGVASDTLLGGEKLEGGNLTASFDRAGLLMRGEARIGGDRAQIDIRHNGRSLGEATLSLALDNAARQKRGLGPEVGVTGVVQVKVVKPLGKGVDAPPRVELDLSRAGIEGLIPGFSKPAGRPGKASFTYLADPDGPDLGDFAFEAGTALIRGKIELNRQNAFESASLTQVKLSPGDNLKIEAKRDGNLTKVVIRGAIADARPFIRDLQSAAGPAQRGDRAAAKNGDLDLDLELPILTGFNNEAIGNAVLKLSKRGGEIRSLAFQGRIGRAELSATQARQGEAAGPIVVQSQDGGALLRFVDLYRRAFGGNFALTMAPGETRQSGELLFRDFVVRDEPALRRVLGQQTAQPSSTGERVGNALPLAGLDANEVAFTKLRAEFTRSASRLDVSDMVIWGQQVGFTLQGNVDYGRDRVDIGGTFVPGYAFNNAFAQIPIVGAILGGGSQYGGLFAVNFRIAGPASAPTMTINPLSAIAPGILRRFVDPLGGAPERQPIQPPGSAAPPPPSLSPSPSSGR